ncbi:restriction endonuclease subunit S [Duganella sp. BuS-21]|uniref:restriction endonuclease subunit S n=1 Tax=Duganella sp. BuS-21 TaxID=2943848 RepID=UPI0035A5DFE4
MSTSMPLYKQTEVGAIPEDWCVAQIGDLEPFVTSGSRGWAAYYSEHGSPFIRITNLSRECVYPDLKDLRYVNVATNDSEAARTQLRDGDILISITADIGIVGLVTGKLPKPAYINQHIALVRFDAAETDSRFVSYFLASETSQKLFRALTDSGAKAGMNLTTVQQTRIAFPPTKAEQEAIAEALSDADALIESLEQLVTKKRHLKRGAMQELLTGRTRLSGFRGDWKIARLDELGTWKGGMTPSMQNSSYWHIGTIPWISSGDVKSVLLTTTGFSITAAAIKQGTTTLLPANSIVVVTRSGILRKYLPIAMNMIPMAINQDIKALIPNDQVISSYLLHTLIGHGDEILARCMKAGTTVESIEFPWMKAFTIPLPPLSEQTAIAAVLSDMDAEIVDLESQLAKARSIKQGMMNKLLTGKIRLI